MTIPAGPAPSFNGGFALTNQRLLERLKLLVCGTGSPITAKAGGGKANATPVTSCNQRVSVVATAADSVLLPAGYPGLVITLYNSGVASMQVFGSGSDTINAAATGVGVAHANGKTATYRCLEVNAGVGLWSQQLGG